MKRVYLLLLLLLFFFNLNALDVVLDVESALHIKDSITDKIIPAVYRGDKLELNVSVKGGGRNTQEPQLDSKNKFNLHKQGQSSSIKVINGQYSSNMKYTYNMQFSDLGLIEIGPFSVNDNGKSYLSNKVLLKVLDPAEKVDSVKNIEDQDDLFCKLSANKRSVYEGEPIELNLKIYTIGKILKIGMDPPSFNGFESIEIKDTISGQEDIDGIIYSVLEKKYILTPIEPGIKSIKPISVQFVIPQKNKRRNRMGMSFFDIDPFFGGNTKTKTTYSNNLQINVFPLPHYNQNVDAVGSFSDLTLSVDKYNADLNEPILLTLQVSGVGNFDQIFAPKLNLPNGITYYDSKSNIKREKQNSPLVGKKVFEYILQVNKTGEFLISPQQFVFFDTDQKVYKTLKSNMLKININNPNSVISSDVSNNSSDVNNTYKSNELLNKQGLKLSDERHINFIFDNISNLRQKARKQIPFYIFLIFLFSPFLFYLKQLFISLIKPFINLFKTKNLFVKFDKKLNVIINKKDAFNLYKFFMKYFSERLDLNQNEINESLIEKYLYKLDWEKNKINEFLSFLHLCASISFASAFQNYIDESKLLDESKDWFFMLESKK